MCADLAIMFWKLLLRKFIIWLGTTLHIYLLLLLIIIIIRTVVYFTQTELIKFENGWLPFAFFFIKSSRSCAGVNGLLNRRPFRWPFMHVRRSFNTVIQVKNLNEIEITFQIRTSEFDLLIKYYTEFSVYIYLHVTPYI